MDLHHPGLPFCRPLLFWYLVTLTFIPRLCVCLDLILLVHYIVVPDFPWYPFLWSINPLGAFLLEISSPSVCLYMATPPHLFPFTWPLVTSFIPCLDHEPSVPFRPGSRLSDSAPTHFHSVPVASAIILLLLEPLEPISSGWWTNSSLTLWLLTSFLSALDALMGGRVLEIPRIQYKSWFRITALVHPLLSKIWVLYLRLFQSHDTPCWGTTVFNNEKCLAWLSEQVFCKLFIQVPMYSTLSIYWKLALSEFYKTQ